VGAMVGATEGESDASGVGDTVGADVGDVVGA
jgi:hypothetical protein